MNPHPHDTPTRNPPPCACARQAPVWCGRCLLPPACVSSGRRCRRSTCQVCPRTSPAPASGQTWRPSTPGGLSRKRRPSRRGGGRGIAGRGYILYVKNVSAEGPQEASLEYVRMYTCLPRVYFMPNSFPKTRATRTGEKAHKDWGEIIGGQRRGQATCGKIRKFSFHQKERPEQNQGKAEDKKEKKTRKEARNSNRAST